jgi:chromosome partitioning protein
MAFMNQKGGVGKTTTVVNIGAALAAAGRSTLVVDMDPQAHATLHLGVEVPDGEASVYDALLDPDVAGEAIRQAREHLWVLPAVTDLAAAEIELADESDRQTRLRAALAPHLPRFEFVLVDCPPSLGVLTLNGLSAVREVIVPMQAHFLALQGVGKLLETVGLIARNANPTLRVSGVILCMHEENTRHAREVVADLESFFKDGEAGNAPWKGARVYRPAIRRNVKLAESPSIGQTVFEYAKGSAGAVDYEQLAAALTAEWDALKARRAATTPTPAIAAGRRVGAA